jgi:hypothetical protein
MENDGTVSHPSHSRLEDADEARVSHISTSTTTILVGKPGQNDCCGSAALHSLSGRDENGLLSECCESSPGSLGDGLD